MHTTRHGWIRLTLLSLGLLVLQPTIFQTALADQDAGRDAAQGEIKADIKGDVTAAREGWRRVEAGALLLDVRSAEEFAAGHLAGAVRAEHTDTEALVAAVGPDTSRQVVLYCGSGRRAGIAIEALAARGYTGLFNATGLEALEATQPQ